jgi:hypothetical protein
MITRWGGVYMTYACLSSANLSSAKNLTREQLDQACGKPDTKLPEGLTLKACKGE